MNTSLPVIDSVEFINMKESDISPLISECEIKVLYIGENRNKSFITKEVATQMSKTLRGNPIIGYYKEENEDFRDHGEQVVINGDGVKTERLTQPYGFVAPNAKVWFQKFIDYDNFGNEVEHEYLMTTGLIWTGRYPECNSIFESEGKPQSMELDENTLDGEWSKNYKTNMEFFIINDATISGLCILGDDVEPCFEGASVTPINVSKSFSINDTDFKQTLFTMVQELKTALEGGKTMPNEDIINTEAPVTENSLIEENSIDSSNQVEDNSVETPTEEIQTPTEAPEDSFSNDNQTTDEDVITDNNIVSQSNDIHEDSSNEPSAEEPEVLEEGESYQCGGDKKKKRYELLSQEYDELQQKYTKLQSDYEVLVAYKNNIEKSQKEELINKFSMLTAEEKADVVNNIDTYSLEEVEAKLSTIFARKQFAAVQAESHTEEALVSQEPITYSLLDQESGESIPGWINAIKKKKNTRS